MKPKQTEKGKKKSMKSSSSEEETGEDDSLIDDTAGVSKPKATAATAFSTYIYRVKKQVHPSINISKSSMKIIESFIEDFFTRICSESSTLMTSAGKKSLQDSDVLAAIKLILPGELGIHAHNEAEKAITSYLAAKASN